MALHLTAAQFAKLGLGEANESAPETWTRERVESAIAQGLDVTSADLSSLSLAGVRLAHGVLTGCTLTGADLAGADLRDTDLSGANLTGANLTGARLSYAKCDGTIFDGATLRRAIIRRAGLRGSFVKADFTKAIVEYSDLDGANLTATTWQDAVIRECTVVGAVLRGVNFMEGRWDRCDFRDSDIRASVIDWTCRELVWRVVAHVRGETELLALRQEGGHRRAMWWTWFDDSLVGDLAAWQQNGDNWPVWELVNRGPVKKIVPTGQEAFIAKVLEIRLRAEEQEAAFQKEKERKGKR